MTNRIGRRMKIAVITAMNQILRQLRKSRAHRRALTKRHDQRDVAERARLTNLYALPAHTKLRGGVQSHHRQQPTQQTGLAYNDVLVSRLWIDGGLLENRCRTRQRAHEFPLRVCRRHTAGAAATQAIRQEP